jgi:serine protease AprX
VAKPDVVAPGAHVISLRAPGSTIDTRYPYYVDGSYRRGSGTSMATGVVSGVVALMLQANPSFTPDRVKYALAATARDAASSDPWPSGPGWPTPAPPPSRLQRGSPTKAWPAPTARAAWPRAAGRCRCGSTTRSTASSARCWGATLTAQLLLWNPGGYTESPWVPSSWYVATWEVNRWNRVSWYGADWPGRKWRGSSWYGQESDESYGSTLAGSAWYGAWE